MTIIALCGCNGCGKDTLSNVLVENGYIPLAIADPVRKAVSIKFRWPLQKLKGLTKEDREWREEVDPYWSNILGWSITPRRALELEGTQCNRDIFGKELNIGNLLLRLDEHKGSNILVTDCRFLNEFEALKKRGAIIVHIDRESVKESWYYDYKERNIVPKNVHRSRYEWIKENHDITIENNGSIEEFQREVKNLLL